MADSAQLELVHQAIRSGVLGQIQWKTAAADRVRADKELHGLTPEAIRALLRQFVLDGHSLSVRQETRAEYLQAHPENPYWYRAVIPVDWLPGGLFVEVILSDDDPDDPWVDIVSVHRQLS